MSQGKPVSDSIPSSDMDGLDSFFDVAPSRARADIAVTSTIEVSISDAAKRLGTSERTVWRRINRGELKSRSKGNKRLVKIPVVTPKALLDSDRHMTLSEVPQQASTLFDLQALLKDLQSANYRLGFLESKLEEHQQQVKLLPDLQAKAEEARRLQAELLAKDAEIARIKSTWWYRFWSWFSGQKIG